MFYAPPKKKKKKKNGSNISIKLLGISTEWIAENRKVITDDSFESHKLLKISLKQKRHFLNFN